MRILLSVIVAAVLFRIAHFTYNETIKCLAIFAALVVLLYALIY